MRSVTAVPTDGCQDRVTTDGLAVYAAGIAAAPVGEANLDNTPFLIFTVDSLSRRMDPEAFLPLFTEWEADLEQGLFLLPLEETRSGLQ